MRAFFSFLFFFPPSFALNQIFNSRRLSKKKGVTSTNGASTPSIQAETGRNLPDFYVAIRYKFIYGISVDGSQTSPRTDSPLCSPKNTSLNFLRGFPKSPPADMAADKKRNLDYCVKNKFFSGWSLLRRLCARGSSSPHRMMGMQLSILLSVLRRDRACATSPISLRHLGYRTRIVTLSVVHKLEGK